MAKTFTFNLEPVRALRQQAEQQAQEQLATELADRIDREVVGRNVIEGRWSFQLVEEYDDGYYATFTRLEKAARDELVQGRRHIFEAEMKADRRTPGREGHEAVPAPEG